MEIIKPFDPSRRKFPLFLAGLGLAVSQELDSKKILIQYTGPGEYELPRSNDAIYGIPNGYTDRQLDATITAVYLFFGQCLLDTQLTAGRTRSGKILRESYPTHDLNEKWQDVNGLTYNNPKAQVKRVNGLIVVKFEEKD